ncbi:MAG: hypothetical protein ABII07_00325 [Patescibacteria group bacterium]|nr:hypothetical protein [Patescibacteria group bacterium]
MPEEYPHIGSLDETPAEKTVRTNYFEKETSAVKALIVQLLDNPGIVTATIMGESCLVKITTLGNEPELNVFRLPGGHIPQGFNPETTIWRRLEDVRDQILRETDFTAWQKKNRPSFSTPPSSPPKKTIETPKEPKAPLRLQQTPSTPPLTPTAKLIKDHILPQVNVHTTSQEIKLYTHRIHQLINIDKNYFISHLDNEFKKMASGYNSIQRQGTSELDAEYRGVNFQSIQPTLYQLGIGHAMQANEVRIKVDIQIDSHDRITYFEITIKKVN